MGLLDPEVARREIRARCPLVPVRRVHPSEALGWVLAEHASAALDVPPFTNSAMDGYALAAAGALRAGDRFRVRGVLVAGDPRQFEVGEGEAVRIMTGAPLPPGTDTVIPIEKVEVEGDWVLVKEPVARGANVRPAGDDVRAGDIIGATGERLTSRLLALLVGAGREEVAARPPPLVGVASTGDELASSPRELGRGAAIVDSNRPLLGAVVREGGFGHADLGILRDKEDVMESTLSEAAENCDAIVTTGGVSVGDRDLVPEVLGRLGEVWSYRLAIKPGKPFAFGLVGRTPVFALPGNPVSALVVFELVVKPVLLHMMGARDQGPQRLVATAEKHLPGAGGRTHYVRCRATVDEKGSLRVEPTGGQGSHQLSAAAGANVLAVVRDPDGVEAGALVEVIPITGAPWPLLVDGTSIREEGDSGADIA